jgi:hypothetical protein
MGRTSPAGGLLRGLLRFVLFLGWRHAANGALGCLSERLSERGRLPRRRPLVHELTKGTRRLAWFLSAHTHDNNTIRTLACTTPMRDRPRLASPDGTGQHSTDCVRYPHRASFVRSNLKRGDRGQRERGQGESS